MAAVRRPVEGQLKETLVRPQIRIVTRVASDIAIARRVEADVAKTEAQDRIWFASGLQQKAATALAKLETALESGHTNQAQRARTAFLRCIQRDRVARAIEIARTLGLTMQKAGRGPLLDHPVLHRQRRLAWRIYPLEAYHGIELPGRARRILDQWETHGGVFDRFYLADEVAGPAPALVTLRAAKSAAALGSSGAGLAARAASVLGRAAGAIITAPARASAASSRALVGPDPCLIGVLSADGVNAEWFILDRWRH